MSEIKLTEAQVDYVLSADAVRKSTARVFEECLAGKTNFKFVEEQMIPTVEFVLQTIEKNYPDLNIPFHSRWGHFNVGGIDRVSKFELLIANEDTLEQCRAKLDLVITSVLLDAGAGASWKYFENSTSESFSRSEGLGVASYYMFLEGHFSSSARPFQADSNGLRQLTTSILEKAFQVSTNNPLVGVPGRVALLNNLGDIIADNPEYFPHQRPGSIIDYIVKEHGKSIFAKDLLGIVLRAFGGIWPSRLSAQGKNLGDVWVYPSSSSSRGKNDLVAFHKLSQWLTYSLIEPIEKSGVEVLNASELTGLAEYRNGGLFVDTGVLVPRDPTVLRKSHRPDSDLIIEWRALTVQLLDIVGKEVQKSLKKGPDEFPLAKVLEGGTWWAGRFIAKEKRSDGSPPIKLDSDGTVF